MHRRSFLRYGTAAATAVATAHFAGCGTIFYPERVGQPRNGPLDWKVVAGDTVALVLFVVPGVIAFVVDIYNGTIFLPPKFSPPPYPEFVPGGATPYSPNPNPAYIPSARSNSAMPAPERLPATRPHGHGAPHNAWGSADFQTIRVAKSVTTADIQLEVSQRIGRTVVLEAEETKVVRLDGLDQFGARVNSALAT